MSGIASSRSTNRRFCGLRRKRELVPQFREVKETFSFFNWATWVWFIQHVSLPQFRFMRQSNFNRFMCQSNFKKLASVKRRINSQSNSLVIFLTTSLCSSSLPNNSTSSSLSLFHPPFLACSHPSSSPPPFCSSRARRRQGLAATDHLDPIHPRPHHLLYSPYLPSRPVAALVASSCTGAVAACHQPPSIAHPPSLGEEWVSLTLRILADLFFLTGTLPLARNWPVKLATGRF